MAKIKITSRITLDEQEITERFIRSGGPGGQNVNKVASAVQLRFDVRNSPNLPEHVRQKILMSGDQRVTGAGEIVISAERFRTQEANRREALDRLKNMIRKAAYVPKKRKPTRPTLASKKRRLEGKKKRGQLKKTRSGKIDVQ
jgi:ribosome-associated protein